MSKPLTIGELKEMYQTLVAFPAYANELSEYEIQEMLNFCHNKTMKDAKVIEGLIEANPNYNYPEGFENNKYEYWGLSLTTYRESTSIIDLLDTTNKKIIHSDAIQGNTNEIAKKPKGRPKATTLESYHLKNLLKEPVINRLSKILLSKGLINKDWERLRGNTTDFAKLIHWLQKKRCFRKDAENNIKPCGKTSSTTVVSPNSMVLILKETFDITTKKTSLSNTNTKFNRTFITETELNTLTDETTKHQ